MKWPAFTFSASASLSLRTSGEAAFSPCGPCPTIEAGPTAISERLGEEGTFALIQPIYELMASAVREQGGSVKDFTGDGIMALFGVPDALEDAPLRACRAGLLIHERLAAAAPAIEAKHGVRPQMRIGVNSGLAVVTQIRGESAADDGARRHGEPRLAPANPGRAGNRVS